MKKLFILLSCAFITKAHAQDTVKRSNDITTFLHENFYVLKKNKNIRQGEYVLNSYGVPIAKGQYKDNKRCGDWYFGDKKGKTVQSVNYDKGTVSVDSADNKMYRPVYTYPDSLAKMITRNPIKIGGSYAGFYPLLFNPKISSLVRADFPDNEDITCMHTFTVDADGTLVMHQIVLSYKDQSKTYTLSDDFLDAYQKQFLPALAGKKPVEAQITIKTGLRVGLRSSF